MRTIVEPKEHIDKLWGKQRIRDGDTYRMMRYVLRVDHDDKVLLHNVVTGQLVVLEPGEAEAINNLPLKYDSIMKELVAKHYLVPEEYDECQIVKSIQQILRKLELSRSKPIKWYTILTTTACNARCYYCFEKRYCTEQSMKAVTMSKETADEVVRFIANHCGEDKSVYITWFGGEPTVAANRIDQICEGLSLYGIKYSSSISTNGYLFDTDMAIRAKQLWHLKSAQICVDGTETSYNKIKNFVSVIDNPYQRVLRNVGLLLNQGIRVGLRMNFDIGNYTEFQGVIEEAIQRFGYNRNLHVNAYPVIGEHPNSEGKINHGSDSWLIEAYEALNSLAKQQGVATERYELPYLAHIGCDADNPMAVNITPEGSLVRCCERFGNEEWVGNVREGVTNTSLVEAWKEVVSYRRCEECVMYPKCLRLTNCVAKDRCYFEREKARKAKEAMRQAYQSYYSTI